jgi:DNA-binding protein HU-beta
LHYAHEGNTFMKASSPSKENMVIGKDELIHQIAAKAGMNLKETSKVIDAFTEVVREGVAHGHEVRLMGFGTWNLRQVAARRVKSIRGGNQITIPARRRVGFSVGAVLSQAALGPDALTESPRTRGEQKGMRNGASNG